MTESSPARREYLDRQSAVAGAISGLGCDVLVSTPGTNLRYLTGLSIHRMLRLTAHILPSSGVSAMIAPAFEESNIRRVMSEGELIPWDESADPYRLLADHLVGQFGPGVRVGLEPTTWFWMAERMRAARP